MAEIINKVILIGNGFDLAHNIPSSYKDFINDFWEREKNSILSKSVSDTKTTKYEDKYIQLAINNSIWELIKKKNADLHGCNWLIETIEMIETNKDFGCLINFTNTLIKDISLKMYITNWADIEYEYYLALIDCVNNKRVGNVERLNEEFAMIKDEFINYMKGPIYSNAIKYATISYNIENIICPSKYDGRIIENSKDNKTLFLNFNYTGTLEGYVESLKYEYKDKIECLHIHGDLYSKYNPIIFGYGDDIDEKYKLIENTNDNRYLDNVKSIKYSDTPNYSKMLAFINSNKYEISIMGLSCGISDRTLLHTLFEHDNCVSIKIYYYEDGDKDNYSDVVKNISRNFNDKSLMRARLINKQASKTLS